MASLADQLKRLAQGNSGAKNAGKIPSLLFTDKEAGDLDMDAVCAIGSNGFEHLLTLAASFSHYAGLFGLAAREINRDLQTKEANVKLDAHIRSFLRHLSPFLTVSAAHKALEWLIRRFNIHIHNMEAVLECFLPYHHTNLFARMMKLMEVEGAPRWTFLVSCKKSGAPLDRTVLVTRCTNDRSLFTFVNQLPSAALADPHPPVSIGHLVSLFVTVCSGVLEGGVSESLVSHLLPVLADGCASTHPQLRAGSYIVVAQLAQATALAPAVANAIMEAIFADGASLLFDEAMSCLCVLTATQSVSAYPTATLGALVSSLARVVRYIAAQDNAHGDDTQRAGEAVPSAVQALERVLLTQLVGAVVAEGGSAKESGKALKELLSKVTFPQAVVESAGKALLQGYLHRHLDSSVSKAQRKALNEAVAPIVALLEASYSTVLDAIVAAELKARKLHGKEQDEDAEDGAKVADKAAELISQFVTLSLGGLRFSVATDSNIPLLLSLKHPEAGIRLQAVKHLKSLVSSTTIEDNADNDFIKFSLVNALADPDAAVAQEALETPSAVFAKFVPRDELAEAFLTVLKKSIAEGTHNLASLAADALSGDILDESAKHSDAFIGQCLSVLLLAQSRRRLSRAVVKSLTGASPALRARYPFLAGLQVKKVLENEGWKATKEKHADTDAYTAANIAIIAAMAEGISQAADEKKAKEAISSLFSVLSYGSNALASKLTVACVLGNVVASAASAPMARFYAGKALVSIATPLLMAASPKTVSPLAQEQLAAPEYLSRALAAVEQVLNAQHQGGNASLLALDAAAGLVMAFLAAAQPSAPKGVSSRDAHAHLKDVFVAITATSLAPAALPVQLFFSKLVPSKQLRFLASVWLTECQRAVPKAARVASLRIATALIAAGKGGKADEDMLAFVPFALAAAQHQQGAVRAAAVALLGAINAHGARVDLGTSGLTHEQLQKLLFSITGVAQEIAADAAFIAAHLGNVFANMSAKDTFASAATALVASIRVELDDEAFVQLQLMRLLKHADIPARLEHSLALLAALVHAAEKKGFALLAANERELFHVLLSSFTVKAASVFASKKYKDAAAPGSPLQTLLAALQLGGADGPSPQTWVLKETLTPEFIAALPAAAQATLFSALCGLLQGHGTHAASLAREVLTHAVSPAALFVEEIARYVEAAKTAGAAADGVSTGAATPGKSDKARATKKRKTADAEASDVPTLEESQHLANALNRTVPVLDVLQYKTSETMPGIAEAIPCLFEVLNLAMSLDASLQGSVEHVKQVVLSDLLTLQEIAPRADLTEDHFNVNLVVQCIRGSAVPQTYNQALLLLAGTAALFPETVLTSIMPIFTFMGSSMLRQDDSYSFLVIERTIDSIIPAVINGSLDQRRALTMVVELVGVFVDAFPHIPQHRRMPLFEHLINNLGAAKYLNVVSALLLKKAVIQQTTSEDEAKASDMETPQQFCLRANLKFPLLVQVNTMISLLRVLASLPAEKPEDDDAATDSIAAGQDRRKSSAGGSSKKMDVSADSAASEEAAVLFDASMYTAKHLRHFKFLLAKQLSAHLSSGKFLQSIVDFEAVASAKDAERLQEMYLQLLRELLAFVVVLKSHSRNTSSSGSTRFWEQLLADIYSSVEKVNGLLSVRDFTTVISELLTSEDGNIRRKAVEILCDRVQQMHNQKELTDDAAADFVAVTGGLVQLVTSPVASKEDEGMAVSIQQAAVYGLNVFAATFADKHPAPFEAVFECVVDLLTKLTKSFASGVELTATALSCLGVLTAQLGTKSLKYLPRFMPMVIASAEAAYAALVAVRAAPEERQKELRARSSLLLQSGLSVLKATVQHMSGFVGPYLKALLEIISHPHLVMESEAPVKASDGEEEAETAERAKEREEVKSLLGKTKAIQTLMATLVPARVLLPALFTAFSEASQRFDVACKSRAIVILDVVGMTVKTFDRNTVKAHYKALFKFVLESMDYRVLCHASGADDSLVSRLEDVLIAAFMSLVMKLSDSLFRPLFLKLSDWALREGQDGRRILIFFKAVNKLQDTLKRFFVSYYGPLLSTCVSILAEPSSKLSGCPELAADVVHEVMDSLRQVFVYDEDSFLNKERFELLLEPLVNQLDEVEGEENYLERIRKDVVPCIAEFAVDIGDEAQWKPLNNQVLLKTQSGNARVRLGALLVVEEFYLRLGDEFLGLLPESVSFIAELLEDDDLEVERQCQKLIATIEQHLGEPLSNYFQ